MSVAKDSIAEVSISSSFLMGLAVTIFGSFLDNRVRR